MAWETPIYSQYHLYSLGTHHEQSLRNALLRQWKIQHLKVMNPRLKNKIPWCVLCTWTCTYCSNHRFEPFLTMNHELSLVISNHQPPSLTFTIKRRIIRDQSRLSIIKCFPKRCQSSLHSRLFANCLLIIIVWLSLGSLLTIFNHLPTDFEPLIHHQQPRTRHY